MDETSKHKNSELSEFHDTQMTDDGSQLFDDSVLEPEFGSSITQSRKGDSFLRHQGNTRKLCKIYGFQFLLGPDYEPITPMVLIFIITAGFLGILLLSTCLPSWLVQIPFTVCFILLVGALTNSAFMDPGHTSRRRIDLDDEDHAQISCRICNVTREEEQKYNISHCSECDICTREFDHHCGVMGNCIGEKNIWGFRLMLIMFIVAAIAAYGVLFYTMITCYGGGHKTSGRNNTRVPLVGNTSGSTAN